MNMVSERRKIVNGARVDFYPAFCCFFGALFVEYAQKKLVHRGFWEAYYIK